MNLTPEEIRVRNFFRKVREGVVPASTAIRLFAEAITTANDINEFRALMRSAITLLREKNWMRYV